PRFRPRAGGRTDRALRRQVLGPRAGEEGLRVARGRSRAMTRAAADQAAAPFAGLFGAKRPTAAPLWLARLRREAEKSFAAQGLPAPGNEDWRQTNVQPLASIPFERAAASGDASELADHPLAELAP